MKAVPKFALQTKNLPNGEWKTLEEIGGVTGREASDIASDRERRYNAYCDPFDYLVLVRAKKIEVIANKEIG